MNNKEFIAEVARRCNYTNASTQKMTLSVFDALLSVVEEDTSFLVPQFGTFESKKRAERILVNPNTGKKMMVPPKLVLNFKPVASFKESVLKGGIADE